MKYIKKQAEPRQLAEFRNKGGTWDTFARGDGKKEVKEQLLAEQNGLCAYCTASIRFDTMKVEHWCSQNECPEDRDLDYTNLLAVCKGKYRGANGDYEHCDTSKKAVLIELNPQEQSHIAQLSYTNNGIMKSSNAIHQKELNSILNLNIAPIQKARKTILETLKLGLNRKYKGRKANYAKELKIWQRYDKPHCMIIIQYLERKMKALG